MAKRLIIRIMESLIHFADSVRYQMKLDGYANDPNITIGKGNKIHSSAHLTVYEGGRIIFGDGNEIMPHVMFMTYGGTIEIGDHCNINPFTIIYGHGNTKIGNNVLIAGHCMIIPANHVFDNEKENINSQGLTQRGIVIEDNVWIAHGCSILDGVTIGEGAVIAAGSVVNRNVEKGTVVGGVPAKFIKYRRD